ncbi:RND superfamily putative drug exporter [Actinoplanes lutulentus]|uniref:RND superfamily putative drug exporter n=1 Tax=Actinoplanes lutulentus TaxID=1287878 RepID=A0A327ZJQ5_9ACTN|nr:MMPL family transporter [Actinoplanes lutulentus]MBB2940566.1 RND superfamily putative drug exporter [Actinoplanes lutulentus]RAK42879.1 RND superfamily putative drug exporter [Actinoplanes lutulentus]
MSRFLHRLGSVCAAHPWRTLTLWIGFLAVALGLAGAFGGDTRSSYDVPGTSSQAGTDLLRERFAAVSGTEARVVLHDTSGVRLDRGLVEEVRQRVGEVTDVGAVGEPRMSADGDTALIEVRYLKPVTDLGPSAVDDLLAATSAAGATGIQVELAGQVPEQETASGSVAEAVGLVAALVILVIAFGSVIAAGLPILAALVGLGVGGSGVILLAAVAEVSSTAPTAAAMIGLGVGIDYALLLVTRHVEGLREGLSPVEAAARATATAGRSILVAGATVLVSLSGLLFAGLSSFYSYGYTTAIIVATVMLTAVTLVPALSAAAGNRLFGRRQRREIAARQSAGELTPAGNAGVQRPTLTARWAQRVGRRPVPWAMGALVFMLLLGAPALAMRTWPQDAGSQPASETVRRAYDLIAQEFGPGAYAPMLIAVDLRKVPADNLPALVESVRELPDVARVAQPVLSPDGSAAAISVQAAFAPSDERSDDLVDELRGRVLPDGAEVTGVTAVFVDIADLLGERLWLVVAVVVGLSLLLLIIVFRSILVPLKAAFVNLLSVAAAYGVLTVVFQWGWGSGLLGLDRPVPVSSWVPVLLFTALFGLSMDYEVFLLSRIREYWLADGDAGASVVRGLAATGRVITSAALIMVVVFAGFAADTDIVVKMLGLGMATAVAVDATVIRMILVPASMAMFGKANWWLPAWLDRILPDIDLEGSEPATQTPSAAGPVTGALAAEAPPADGPATEALAGPQPVTVAGKSPWTMG